MAGHNTTATVQTPVVYERMIPHPLDKWSNISAKAQVGTQIPSGVRYQGMMVWVEDEKIFYHFKDGILDTHLVKLSSTLEGIRTFDALVNTTANNKLEVKHDLGASNISITFQHNDEFLLVGWKRGKIDGTDKGNYIHFSTDVDYTSLRVFIISKDLSPTQPTHPNLDNELATIQVRLNTTRTNLDTFQEIGDTITSIQTTVAGHTTALTTTHTEYNTFQEIGDKLNSLSENLRDVDTALSITSTNLIENKAVAIAMNTKISDAPSNTNSYARKGGAWVVINNITVDSALSLTSENPVQNKIVKAELDTKITDAPNNTKVYGRKGASWVEIQSDLKDPKNYTYTLSDVSASGVMTLHAVKGDNTIISKVLDNAFIGSSPLTKGAGWINKIQVYGSNLVILYTDRTTSNARFLIFKDFHVDEFNNTFTFSSVKVVSTTQTVAQNTPTSLINTSDDVYVLFGGTPSKIIRYSVHDFVEVQSFEFPNNIDWNNASHIFRNGNFLYFVAGNTNYTGTLRISRIKTDLSSYNKYFDINQNTNAVGVPTAGMKLLDGYIYIYQSTWDDTKFHMLKIDVSNVENPKLDSTVTHNFTQGSNKGLVNGLEIYSNRIYVSVGYIGGATATTDRQMWVLKTTDLSVVEKLTLGDDSGNYTISPQGRLIWSTTNNTVAGTGESDAKLLSIDVMDVDATAPTTLLDIPTTSNFNAISFRVTDTDVIRNTTGIPSTNGVFVGGIVHRTVYVSTSGDDSTAVIGDYTKPFKTDSEAIASIPIGTQSEMYTLHVLGNSFTFNSTTLPQRYFRILCHGNGTLDFSSFTTDTTGTGLYPFELFTPNNLFKYVNATNSPRFGSSGSYTKIDVRDVLIHKDNSTSQMFNTSSNTSDVSYFKCSKDFTVNTDSGDIFNLSGLVRIGGKLIFNGGVFFIKNSNNTILDFNEIVCNSGTNQLIPYDSTGNTKIKIGNIAVNNSSILYIRRTYTNDKVEIIFDNSVITGNGSVFAVDNMTGEIDIHISGKVSTTKGFIVSKRETASAGVGTLTLNRFFGKIEGTNVLSISEQHNMNIISSEIHTVTNLVNVTSSLKKVNFYGYNTFIQDTPSPLFNGVTVAVNVDKYGMIKTNATSVGTNVTLVDRTTNTF